MREGKIWPSALEAVGDVCNGASVCMSGFGPLRNRPMGLVHALAQRPEVRDLTIIANSFQYPELARQRQFNRLIAAFGSSVTRRNDETEALIRNGEVTFEPCPQGILVERLRAGAAGVPAFYSPVGVDTVVADGKERRSFDDRDYILETALRPDFPLCAPSRAMPRAISGPRAAR